MPIGAMRERAVLQVKGTTADVGPGKTVAWTTLEEVWAQVTPLTTREVLQAQSMGSAVAYRIRYRTNVTPDNRLTWAGKTLQIQSVVRVDGRTRYLDMLCGEIA